MKYAPLFFVIGYLLLTLALTIFGPINYHEFDLLKVGSFIAAICVAISIGYIVAIRTPMTLPIGAPLDAASRNNGELIKTIFSACLMVSSIGFVITLASLAGSGQLNTNLNAIGETYVDSYKDYQLNSGNYSIAFILYTILAAPNFVTTIWGMFFFKNLTNWRKMLVLIVALGSPLIFTLSAGTQKNIGDIIVYLSSVFLIRSISKTMKLNSRAIWIVTVIGTMGVAAMMVILSQRYAVSGTDASNINERAGDLLTVDLQHPIFKITGPAIGFLLTILIFYLTNGFNGLSYALNIPFRWTYLLGSSYSMSVIGQRVLGVPFQYVYTYPYRAAYASGWGESLWYSVFSWFASDVTFLGVVPLFGFFAYVYARAWGEVIRFKNPFSIMLFCLLNLGVAMMACNNQLMQTPGGLATLGLTVFLYFRYRRRFNRDRPYA